MSDLMAVKYRGTSDSQFLKVFPKCLKVLGRRLFMFSVTQLHLYLCQFNYEIYSKKPLYYIWVF